VTAPKTRHGGRVLVDQLVVHGADTAFTVPGESFLPVLDGFYDVQDKVKLVICRHEAGAANMAEAYGKLTNRPGLCFVTRGPGATQAAVGVHTAFQDSTPMILFIGVESWNAVCTPTEACVAPGPRVTKHRPGWPVSLP